MIHSRLISFLNKHILLQSMFCLLPIVFILVYMLAFLTDFSNIYSGAVTNASYLESDTNAETLIKAKSAELVADRVDTKLDVNMRSHLNTTTTYLMTVYYFDDDWVKIVYQDTSFVYVPSDTFDFIKDIKKDNDGISFKIADKRYFALDTLMFRVYTIDSENTNANKYLLSVGESETSITKKIKQLSYSTGTYTLHIKYKRNIKADELVYCVGHFKDNSTYYDIRTKQCIKELDSAAITTFLLNSNIWWFITAMILYLAMLAVIYQKKVLSVLTKRVLVVNIISFLLLPVLYSIPYLMIN